jgi:uncharacterized protein (TIGR03435 family)
MIRAMKFGLPAVLVALSVVNVRAQAPVVISSVKPSADLDEGAKGNNAQGGTYRLGNAPLTVLIDTAYGIEPNRVIGGPEWIRHDRWDVEAKRDPSDGGPALGARALAMAVLRDRFKLDAAVEQRDRPIYAMRTARGDRQPGPNLVPSKFECKRNDVDQQRALQASDLKGAHGQRPCLTRSQFGIVSFAGLPIDNLLPFIPADRVVRNETGITGPVDLHLTWTHADDPVADQASLHSAIREQLGLKLESATAPLDVLVIKSVSRPAAN